VREGHESAGGGAFDNINKKPDVKGEVLSEAPPHAPGRRYRKPPVLQCKNPWMTLRRIRVDAFVYQSQRTLSRASYCARGLPVASSLRSVRAAFLQIRGMKGKKTLLGSLSHHKVLLDFNKTQTMNEVKRWYVNSQVRDKNRSLIRPFLVLAQRRFFPFSSFVP
jgi:hypothetical protein